MSDIGNCIILIDNFKISNKADEGISNDSFSLFTNRIEAPFIKRYPDRLFIVAIRVRICRLPAATVTRRIISDIKLDFAFFTQINGDGFSNTTNQPGRKCTNCGIFIELFWISEVREFLHKSVRSHPSIAMEIRTIEFENNVPLNDLAISIIDALAAWFSTQSSKVRFPSKKEYLVNRLLRPANPLNQLFAETGVADHHLTQRSQIAEIKTNISSPGNTQGHTVPPIYDAQTRADRA